MAMPRLADVAGLAAVGKSLAEPLLYRRLLPRLVRLVALTMLTGILAALLLAGLLYGAYALLVQRGMLPQAAYVSVGIGLAAATAIAAALTARHLRSMHRALQPLSSLAEQMHRVADAFADGLLTPPEHKENAHDL